MCQLPTTNMQKHKNSGNTVENLLKPCPIHAHHKFKNFFTSCLHDTDCLHSFTTASWLHKKAN